MSAHGVVDAATGTGDGDVYDLSSSTLPTDASSALVRIRHHAAAREFLLPVVVCVTFVLSLEQALEWVFGFAKDIVGGLHSLTDATRDVRHHVHAVLVGTLPSQLSCPRFTGYLLPIWAHWCRVRLHTTSAVSPPRACTLHSWMNVAGVSVSPYHACTSCPPVQRPLSLCC